MTNLEAILGLIDSAIVNVEHADGAGGKDHVLLVNAQSHLYSVRKMLEVLDKRPSSLPKLPKHALLMIENAKQYAVSHGKSEKHIFPVLRDWGVPQSTIYRWLRLYWQ